MNFCLLVQSSIVHMTSYLYLAIRGVDVVNMVSDFEPVLRGGVGEKTGSGQDTEKPTAATLGGCLVPTTSSPTCLLSRVSFMKRGDQGF